MRARFPEPRLSATPGDSQRPPGPRWRVMEAPAPRLGRPRPQRCREAAFEGPRLAQSSPGWPGGRRQAGAKVRRSWARSPRAAARPRPGPARSARRRIRPEPPRSDCSQAAPRTPSSRRPAPPLPRARSTPLATRYSPRRPPRVPRAPLPHPSPPGPCPPRALSAPTLATGCTPARGPRALLPGGGQVPNTHPPRPSQAFPRLPASKADDCREAAAQTLVLNLSFGSENVNCRSSEAFQD